MSQAFGSLATLQTTGMTPDLLAQLSFLSQPFAQPAFASMGMRVINGVHDRAPIQATNRMKYLFSKDITRDGTFAALPQNYYQKFVEVSKLIFFKGQNPIDFYNTLNAIVVPPAGQLRGDLTGDATRILFQQTITDALTDDIIRIAFLGDTASGNANYTQLNGFIRLIRQAIYDYTQNSTLDPTKISTYDTGAISSTAAAATAALETAFFQASPALKSVPVNQKKFLVSQSVYDLYVQGLGTVYNTMGWQFIQSAPNGQTLSNAVYYKGIEVVPISAYDRYVAADFTNSGASTLPANMIIFTMLDNLVVGTDRTSGASDLGAAIPFQVYYDMHDLQTKFLSECAIGVNFGNGELISTVGFTAKNYA
jgi:hypothetical protein